MNRKTALALCALVVGVGLGGCGRKIGDKCKDNLDCNSEDATRTCDLSQQAGYCTIEGCDQGSCPSEAVCIRTFPKEEFVNTVCDPALATSCDPQELCVLYPVGGRCVPRSTERDNCMLRCSDDGDCRDDYTCRETGSGNTIALTPNPGEKSKFCAQRVP